MGYCTNILEIGFFDGRGANEEDSFECVHFYEGRHRKQKDKYPTLEKAAAMGAKQGKSGNYTFRRDNMKNSDIYIRKCNTLKSVTHMDYFHKCVIWCNIRRTQFPKSSANELLAGLHNWFLKLVGNKSCDFIAVLNYLRISKR
jgi:hypothetical protein